jgi:hypothetical protein
MNKLSKDLILSISFALLNMILSMWLIKRAEFVLPAIALGVFLLMRRVGATFTNLSQLGTSQGIIRFVSLNNNDIEKKRVYFFIAFSGWVFSIVVIGFLYVFLKQYLATFIYNDVENSILYVGFTFWYIIILHLSYIIHPYFLTQRKIVSYNIINITNASVFFIIIFYYYSTASLEIILYNVFLILSVFQLILMLLIITQLKLYNLPKLKSIKGALKTFYYYSIPRSIITFLDMFLLTIGSLLMSKNEKIIASFLIAIALSRMVLIVLLPVSKLSSVIIANDHNTNKEKKAVNVMTATIVYSTLIFIIILYNWLGFLLDVWLNNTETINNIIYAFNFLVFGLLPYAYFQSLKGIIEIKFFKPYNLYSLIIAVIVHISVFLVLRKFYSALFSLSISITLAFLSLGLLTVYWLRKDFFKNNYFRFEVVLTLCVLIFGINYFAKIYFNSILGFLSFSLFSLLIYGLVILKVKPLFLKEAVTILFKKNNS